MMFIVMASATSPNGGDFRQRDLFVDPPTAAELKRKGMAAAEKHAGDVLALARRIAVEIALSRSDRVCCADDVASELSRRGLGANALGNAAGSTFRGDNWRFTGRFVKSTRPVSHGNLLRVWEYVGPISQMPTAKDLAKQDAQPAEELSHCPRCRRLTASVKVPIHAGASTRDDCRVCRAVKGFSRWNPPPILGQLTRNKQ